MTTQDFLQQLLVQPVPEADLRAALATLQQVQVFAQQLQVALRTQQLEEPSPEADQLLEQLISITRASVEYSDAAIQASMRVLTNLKRHRVDVQQRIAWLEALPIAPSI